MKVTIVKVIITCVILLIISNGFSQFEDMSHEIIFKEITGCGTTDTLICTAVAAPNLVRWDGIIRRAGYPTINFGTAEAYAIVDQVPYSTDNADFGFDAPSSHDAGIDDDDLAYGFYAFIFQHKHESFSRVFTIDCRDWSWCPDGADFYLRYSKGDGKLEIKGHSRETTWEEIDDNDNFVVWQFFEDNTQHLFSTGIMPLSFSTH